MSDINKTGSGESTELTPAQTQTTEQITKETMEILEPQSALLTQEDVNKQYELFMKEYGAQKIHQINANLKKCGLENLQALLGQINRHLSSTNFYNSYAKIVEYADFIDIMNKLLNTEDESMMGVQIYKIKFRLSKEYTNRYVGFEYERRHVRHRKDSLNNFPRTQFIQEFQQKIDTNDNILDWLEKEYPDMYKSFIGSLSGYLNKKSKERNHAEHSCTIDDFIKAYKHDIELRNNGERNNDTENCICISEIRNYWLADKIGIHTDLKKKYIDTDKKSERKDKRKWIRKSILYHLGIHISS